MSVVVPVGEYQCQVIHRVTGSAKQMGWTLGIRNDGASRTPSEIAASVRDAVVDSGVFAPSTASAEYSLFGVKSYFQVNPTDKLIGFASANVQGTGSWQPPPVNSALLVSRNTAVAGRRGQGRIYLPPFSIDESSTSAAGALSSTLLAAMQTRFNGLLAELEAVELLPVLFGSPPAETSGIILAFTPQSLLATQRRRMR